MGVTANDIVEIRSVINELFVTEADRVVGKRLPTAFYVHNEGMADQPLVLRLWEYIAQIKLRQHGCLHPCPPVIKFHLHEPVVSYLIYPTFFEEAHPGLLYVYNVHMPLGLVKEFSYLNRQDNPPILHRKELMIPCDHLHYARFDALSQQEEDAGLLATGSTIGTRKNWEKHLKIYGYKVQGHTLRKRR